MSGQARIADVARRAGLSPSTVSYVLNDRADVPITAATRERVWQAANELGYVPNPVARALRTGRTQTIGLSMPLLAKPYAVELLQQLHECVAASGYRTLITAGGGQQTPAVWPVDGVIAQASGAWLTALRSSAHGRALPLVLIEGPGVPGADHITYDLRSGMRAAVAHLFEQGCDRVAFLGPRYDAGCEGQRLGGYLEAVAEAGRQPELVAVGRDLRREGYDALLAHAREHGCPDGLLCFNDDLALGAYRAVADLGLRVGQDVAVVGFDGLATDDLLCPRLSSVELPLAEVASAAWRLLSERLAEHDLPTRRVVFQARLVVRESSRRP